MPAVSFLHEFRYRVEPCGDFLPVHERSENPSSEHPPPHWRLRTVQDFDQRPALARPQRFDDLEIPPRHLIEVQESSSSLDSRRAEMTQAAGADFFQVRGNGPGSRHEVSIVR
jgi:hypothetical protein